MARPCRLALWHTSAVLMAAKRYLRLLWRYPQVLAWLRGFRGGAWGALREISFARRVQRALNRSIRGENSLPLVRHVLIEGETRSLKAGAVLAFFHSPWDRLLARWVVSRSFALVLAAEWAASLLGASYVRQDRVGLRKIVRHLRAGGRAAIAMDSFAEAGGCAARFLGAPVRILPGAVRLAAAGRVPVVPVSATYASGCLRIRFGPAIQVGAQGVASGAGVVLEFFDRIARDEPAAWSGLLPFLRERAVRTG